eukprot:1486820-Rhodomonas_salina.1
MWVARRLKICFAVLFACSAGGFGVMQFFLFENYAQRDSHLINQTGGLRTIAVTALYNLRSMLIAAADNDRQTVRELGAQVRRHVSICCCLRSEEDVDADDERRCR